MPSGAGSTLRAVPVLLDLPGPSRRIRVEPLRLPEPAREPVPEPPTPAPGSVPAPPDPAPAAA